MAISLSSSLPIVKEREIRKTSKEAAGKTFSTLKTSRLFLPLHHCASHIQDLFFIA